MKIFESYEKVGDVWKLPETVKVENEKHTMFFSPCQRFTAKDIEMLEKEGVYLDKGRNHAVMLREETFVLGGAAEGWISFLKSPENISPDYENEYPKEEAFGILEAFKKAGLIS